MAREVFAFGDTKVHGVACVAKQSDESLDGELLGVAERYDEVVRERYGISEGILPASVAESCWRKAVEMVREDMETEQDFNHRKYLKRAHDQAVNATEQVFG